MNRCISSLLLDDLTFSSFHFRYVPKKHRPGIHPFTGRNRPGIKQDAYQRLAFLPLMEDDFERLIQGLVTREVGITPQFIGKELARHLKGNLLALHEKI